MIKLFSILLVIAFVAMGVVVGLLNPISVELNLFLLTVTLPLSVVMSALLVVGMLVGAVIIYTQVIKLRWLLRAKTRQNQKLSDEIIQLKKQQVEHKENQVREEIDSPDKVLISIGK